MSYKLWVNEARTVLVTQWEDGTMHVVTRLEPGAIWGPPVVVRPESTVIAKKAAK